MRKIAELRRELGLSRSQLARRAGIPARTLEAYEQGLKEIKKAGYLTVRELAHALGVPVETIAGRSATELRAELERLGYAPSFIAQMSDAEVYKTEDIDDGAELEEYIDKMIEKSKM